MSTYKRSSGNIVFETINANSSVTFVGPVANAISVVIDGDLTVSGNASLTGNISGDRIFNGTSSIEIPLYNGNANITVGGVSNVLVVSTNGIEVTGNTVVTGNATVGNLSVGGVIAGNVTFGNVNTSGNVVITRDAGLSQPTIQFNDTDTAVAANVVAGAIEWYTSDITTPGARVASAIRSTYTDLTGNARVEILTGTTITPTVVVTVLPTGNVGIANTNPNTTLGVTGTGYFSSTLQAAGNITGGNLITAGQVTASANITGGNIVTGGLITAVGNINGANVNVTTGINVGASGVTATGNIRGGNVVSDAQITAVGNITGDNLITQGLVTATGNIVGNNINAGNIVSTVVVNATGNISAAGNVTGANLVTGGLVTSTGNVNAGAFYTAGQTYSVGNITTGGFFIGDGGFLSNVTAISNVTTSQIANGTTVLAVASSNGNIFATVNAIGNIMVLWPGGAEFTGSVAATGNISAANVNTAGNVSVTGNVNTANLLVAGTANIGTLLTNNINANALTSGTVSSDRLTGIYSINVSGYAATANTVTVAAQPNITSVGNLTSVVVVGNVTAGNLLLSGAIVDSAQLDIQTSAANANIVLTPNGTGNVNVGRISASGNITAVAYYGSGAGLTSIPGANVTGTVANATYSTSAGSAATASTVTGNAQGNITSVGTLTSLSVSGNVTTSGQFIGSGDGLTSIPGANVTGTVANATYATSAGSATSATTAGTVTTAAQGNITSVGTLTSLSVSGNITAGNLLTAGTTGLLSVNSITHTGTNAVGNIGSSSSYFNQVFATATTALYADLAEKYSADKDYPAGTVVSFGGSAEVTESTVDGDRRIAGVVSGAPSYLMNAGLNANYPVIVALQGRVPCQVVGPVAKGDMMVSAGAGRARAETNPSVGAVIGKALEDFNGDFGTIEVVVGRI